MVEDPSVLGNWPDLAGRITDGGHLLPVRVYFENTDFSGVVYHADYLKFCERGRSDFLRLAGIHHSLLLAGQESGEPLSFVVARMEIDFFKPARIDDVLDVRTRFLRLGGAKLELDQCVSRSGQDLVRMAVSVAVVDQTGKPRRIPERVRECLRRVCSLE